MYNSMLNSPCMPDCRRCILSRMNRLYSTDFSLDTN